MAKRHMAILALIAVLTVGSLIVIAGCSRPTPVPGTGGEGAYPAAPSAPNVESTEPPYPRPATAVPTAVPEGYVAPELRTPAPTQ